MNKLDKLNKLVFEYQCQLADVEASGKDFEKISKLLNDTIKERKDYIPNKPKNESRGSN